VSEGVTASSNNSLLQPNQNKSAARLLYVVWTRQAAGVLIENENNFEQISHGSPFIYQINIIQRKCRNSATKGKFRGTRKTTLLIMLICFLKWNMKLL